MCWCNESELKRYARYNSKNELETFSVLNVPRWCPFVLLAKVRNKVKLWKLKRVACWKVVCWDYATEGRSWKFGHVLISEENITMKF